MTMTANCEEIGAIISQEAPNMCTKQDRGQSLLSIEVLMVPIRSV